MSAQMTSCLSIKMQYELKSLSSSIESWVGGVCSSLHGWMRNVTTATWLGFDSNSNSFRTKCDLLKIDRLYTNKIGTEKLISVFTSFIAFNYDFPIQTLRIIMPGPGLILLSLIVCIP